MLGVGGTALAVAFVSVLPGVSGHGKLVFPPLRGGVLGSSSNKYCPHCGNGGGVCGDGGQWGDSDFLGAAETPQATFTAGDVVEFEVLITAHHKGHFEFSICDRQLGHDTQDPYGCLEKHKLKRAIPPNDCVPNDSRGDCQPIHEEYPERWYLPPGSGTWTMRFQIPPDLQCDACTLQWRWWTANSCVPAKDYGCYFDKLKALRTDGASWCSMCGTCTSSLLQANASSVDGRTTGCGEEFRNCADIKVLPSGSSNPAPTPAPAPAPAPTPMPVPVDSADCVPLGDCGMHSWCEQQDYVSFCASTAAAGSCDPTFCMVVMPEPEPEPEPAPVCIPAFDCGMHNWCDQELFIGFCASQSAAGGSCGSTFCEPSNPSPQPQPQPQAMAATQQQARRVMGKRHKFVALLQTQGKVDRGTEALGNFDEL